MDQASQILSHGGMDPMAELIALRAENARLKAIGTQGYRLGVKASEKGAVCVYGLGKFPTTLYAPQWEALLAYGPNIQAFITKHKAVLSTKKLS